MKSIRLYLLLALLATIILVSFLSVLQGYRSSTQKVDALFDQRLADLADIIVHANHDTKPRQERMINTKPSVFFQIWSDSNVLLARSGNAPTGLIVDLQDTGQFRDINFNQYRWRTYILKDDSLNRSIITAERIDLRYSLADTIVSTAIKPTVIAIPMAAIIIWFAIGFGLRPLKQLTGQLSNKRADDLTPVVLKDTPKELSQLVTTTNDLLSRLNDAFMREQQFAADAAHELRTPISALNVQMHNLKQQANFQDAELAPLIDGVERMGHVVEQILSLYRNSPDQVFKKFQAVNLYTLAQKILAEQYTQFEEKNQPVSLIGDESCCVNGDEFALKTLLLNLINNAAKYSPDKSEIQVTVEQNKRQICLMVEDAGPGVPKEAYGRVLERFYRVDGDQHGSGEIGCGLGLAIVKHIVTIHNAKITLSQSELLGGLSVRVEFKGA
jgi:two-component system sensor histidine kinase QseC